MDCYISVFQSLSSHTDEITEKKEKKRKEEKKRRKKRGEKNPTDSKGKREFTVPLSSPNQEITFRYRYLFFVLETDYYSHLSEI